MISDQVFLICQATRLSLRHKDMDTTRKEINAMEDLREKVDEVFSDENLAFPYSIFYLGWETNKVRVKSRREKKLLLLLLLYSLRYTLLGSEFFLQNLATEINTCRVSVVSRYQNGSYERLSKKYLELIFHCLLSGDFRRAVS